MPEPLIIEQLERKREMEAFDSLPQTIQIAIRSFPGTVKAAPLWEAMSKHGITEEYILGEFAARWPKGHSSRLLS